MDSTHSRLEQQLQQVKKAQDVLQDNLRQTKRKQVEQEWLESEKRVHLEEEARTTRAEMHDIETKQASLRKEWNQ
ncbi:TPA_asm: hypothetical protein GYZ23_00700 [Listeria monocytogenes]|nr:hypothetical protein [Listeria monocytogenes]